MTRRGDERRRASAVLRELHLGARVARLRERCRQLEAGLLNDESDPTLIFLNIPYAEAMKAATADPVIARTLTRLPNNWRWCDE